MHKGCFNIILHNGTRWVFVQPFSLATALTCVRDTLCSMRMFALQHPVTQCTFPPGNEKENGVFFHGISSKFRKRQVWFPLPHPFFGFFLYWDLNDLVEFCKYFITLFYRWSILYLTVFLEVRPLSSVSPAPWLSCNCFHLSKPMCSSLIVDPLGRTCCFYRFIVNH